MSSSIGGIVRIIKRKGPFLALIVLDSIDDVWDQATVRIYDGIPRSVKNDFLGRNVKITTELKPPKREEDVEMVFQTIQAKGKGYLVKIPYSAVRKINQAYD